ncbi:hypothetical protein CSUI_005757 [Cystoisospora suis]|uniref:Uncharacterized protein n=1 Tax=Cystoisospora suis TaxID=483139 RepID=A0A2C6K479_9APIC|nr:hypothetical protein CSUI_005757 [Cystoisospora suis]
MTLLSVRTCLGRFLPVDISAAASLLRLRTHAVSEEQVSMCNAEFGFKPRRIAVTFVAACCCSASGQSRRQLANVVSRHLSRTTSACRSRSPATHLQ